MPELEHFQMLMKDLAKKNPAAAGVILAGASVLIFAAKVFSDPSVINNAGPVALWTVGIGFLIVVLAYIATHKFLMPLVASCAIIFGVAYAGAAGLSFAFPEDQRLACIVNLPDCREGADRSAASEDGSNNPLAPGAVLTAGIECGCSTQPNFGPLLPQATMGLGTSEGRSAGSVRTAQPFLQPVYVQFAGAITRDAVRTFMKQLRAAGWEVQGVDGGGERTTKADGLSVVRYAPADKDAAVALVALLNEWKVIDRTFVPEDNPLIQAGSLEIWMGR